MNSLLRKIGWTIGLVVLISSGPSFAAATQSDCAEQDVNRAYFAMLNRDHQQALLLLKQAENHAIPYLLTDFFTSVAYWVEAYLGDNQQARRRSLKQIERSVFLLVTPEDVTSQGFLYYVIARGHMVRILFAEDKLISAIRIARKVKKQATALLATFPDHPDLLLLLGLFELHSANIPDEYRWIARLFKLNGDARLGRIWINKAINSGSAFSAEAARALLHESNWRLSMCQQAGLAEQLAIRAPRSAQLALLKQGLYVFCGHAENAKLANEEFESLNVLVTEEEQQALFDIKMHVYSQLVDIPKLQQLQTARDRDERKRRFALAQALDIRNGAEDRAAALSIYQSFVDEQKGGLSLRELANIRLKWPAQLRQKQALGRGLRLQTPQCHQP